MNREFAVHVLNEKGKRCALEIAEAFDVCLERLQAIDPAPESTAYAPAARLRAIVRTKLEEACFFAKKAMASDPSNVEAR